MNGKAAIVLLSGLLCACAQTQPPAAAAPPALAAAAPPAQAAAPPPSPAAGSVPADRIVSIRGANCETLLNLSPDDRVEAAMFYIGYQASRVRARTISVSLIPSIQTRAFDYCAAYPERPVVQAFAYAYLRTGK